MLLAETITKRKQSFFVSKCGAEMGVTVDEFELYFIPRIVRLDS